MIFPFPLNKHNYSLESIYKPLVVWSQQNLKELHGPSYLEEYNIMRLSPEIKTNQFFFADLY